MQLWDAAVPVGSSRAEHTITDRELVGDALQQNLPDAMHLGEVAQGLKGAVVLAVGHNTFGQLLADADDVVAQGFYRCDVDIYGSFQFLPVCHRTTSLWGVR